MGWQKEMVRILRYIISDIDTVAPIYDEERLVETVLVSAQLVINEIDFNNTYTIDVDECVLSPDPTAVTKDNAFINLVCLRAALLVLFSEYKTASINSIRVSDGPSTIDMTDSTRNSKTLYDNALLEYERAKFAYRAGNSIGGQAVLTPYTFEGVHGGFNGM